MRRVAFALAGWIASSIALAAQSSAPPAPPPAAPTASRRLAIVLDTSSSMAVAERDSARRTIQLSKILSDLVSDRDDLAVVVMPARNEKLPRHGVIEPGLVRALDKQDRTSFKDSLETVTFSTSTAMLTPVRTAIDWLGPGPASQRLLLIMTDAAGFDCCAAEVAGELRAASRDGVLLAAVGVGTDANTLFHGVDMVARRTAHDAEALTESVAEIYQRFLGGRNVTRGMVGARVRFTIDPYVREAFVVIAADGPVPVPTLAGTNPGADQIDPNFRGGHETYDVDRRLSRGYRIVRLSKPRPGSWNVDMPGLPPSAAFLVIQDYALSLRLLGPDVVPTGSAATLSFGIFDDNTGQRLSHVASLPGNIRASVDLGQGVELLTMNAATGTFTLNRIFSKAGTFVARVRLQSDTIDRETRLTLTSKLLGRLHIEMPQAADYGDRVAVRVRVFDPPAGHAALPDRLVASVPEGDLTLNRVAGATTEYAGQWRAAPSGRQRLRFELPDGMKIAPAEAELDVKGWLRWPRPPAITLGPVRGGGEARAIVDLSGAEIGGTVEVDVTTDLALERTQLLVDDGRTAARPLGTKEQPLRIASGGRSVLSLRLHAGECPDACAPEAPHYLQLSHVRASGAREVVRIPLRVNVVGDAWYYCWRYELSLLAIVTLTSFIAGGIYMPARFGRGAGVQIADTSRLDEGVFYLLRRVRGSRSGFYRDAQVFVTQDYRVTAQRRNAVVRLRAHQAGVLITPELGASVARRGFGLTWEPLQAEEPMQPGVPYRSGNSRLFFELRAQ